MRLDRLVKLAERLEVERVMSTRPSSTYSKEMTQEVILGGMARTVEAMRRESPRKPGGNIRGIRPENICWVEEEN